MTWLGVEGPRVAAKTGKVPAAVFVKTTTDMAAAKNLAAGSGAA